MKKFLALILAVVLVLVFLLLPKKNSAPPPGNISPEASISNAFATATPSAKAAIDSSFPAAPAPEKALPAAVPGFLPKAGKANPPEITSMEPRIVLGNVRNAIINYGQRFSGNPVGSNAEITRALLGDNPKQVNFISTDSGLRVNANGEMTDAWGTPFFFHQLSGTDMEIRSAGPDKIMWTDDDLVLH